MAIQGKTNLVAIVDDDDLMRGALQGLLKAVGLPSPAHAVQGKSKRRAPITPSAAPNFAIHTNI